MSWVYRPKHPKANENGMVERSELYEDRAWTVSVISDSMEPTKHHGTGRMISSKREFSRETRRNGFIELGTEKIQPRKPITLDKGERREAIRRSIYELRNGR